MDIANSTVLANISTGNGGGISNHISGTVAIANTTIGINSASSFGGGIYNEGSLTLTNGSISYNSAANGGGIFITGTVTVSNSAFYSNTANTNGGGIYNDIGGTATVSNNTFSSNRANVIGGGIYDVGTLTVTNNALASNHAGVGGGIYQTSGAVTLRNTIVAYNTAATDKNCGGAGGIFTDGGNNLQWNPNSGCGSFTAADPKLGPLANNGGPTLTMALLRGSAAIDAANDANCPGTDQRGWHRPFGPHCDIGAYERGAFLYPPLIIK